jgi:all-trans-8'-apo-beta-carotenal 15,15'-oxygenase
MRRLQGQAGFVFHHANGFEQGDELVIDSVCYGDVLPQINPNQDFREVDFEGLAPGQLWRFRLNLQTEAVSRERLDERCVEFPTLNPARVGRPYRYVYLGAAHAPTGNAPLQALIKLDLNSGTQSLWSAAPRGFVSEPIFVPHPEAQAEDEGWLLAVVYNAATHRSDVVILDAQQLAQGPIARLHLRYHIPYGLHGSFTPDWFGPAST